jgi:hypothetical protein
MKTMCDAATRTEMIGRLRSLTPDTERVWGTMTAAQMIAHLTDQMRHMLGDVKANAVPGIRRTALVRYLAIYWVPWPKGRIKGPVDAFVTKPVSWQQDLDTLIALVERIGQRSPEGIWSEHAFFGPMTGHDWCYFCHKHFDHHLRQFGK